MASIIPNLNQSRRNFLGSALSLSALGGLSVFEDMTSINVLSNSLHAETLKKQQKHVILVWLAGGISQLETFDPKPGTETGGPYGSIATKVPGIHISELLPEVAKRMDKMCLIRSLNTRIADHTRAAKQMMRGRSNEAVLNYPDLGAVIAKEMGRRESKVPDYVSFYSPTEGRNEAPGDPGFLGSRYGPMNLYENSSPTDLIKNSQINDLDFENREQLRQLFSNEFAIGRSSNSLSSHNFAYQRVRGLMASEKLFDLSTEPERVRAKYGKSQFGEQALITRRLIEAGVPFVRLARAWWDSHSENFETHQEMLPEFDHVFTTLIDDLNDRGLLDHTLIITLSEFGRTPTINPSMGRDHFASAWSCSLTGCGIQGGALYGKTDAKGEKVIENPVNAATLFATVFSALGINHQKNYHVGSRPVPLTDPGTEPINEVLSV